MHAIRIRIGGVYVLFVSLVTSVESDVSLVTLTCVWKTIGVPIVVMNEVCTFRDILRNTVVAEGFLGPPGVVVYNACVYVAY